LLIIALAIVITKTQREVRLGQVWLQANGRVGRRTRLFLSRGSGIVGVIHPIVDPCQSGKRSCKVRIESCCLLKKLLSFFNSWAKFVRTRVQIVSLEKREVGFAVFRGLTLDLRLFRGLQLRLQCARDLLCQIGLNCEDIGYMAMV